MKTFQCPQCRQAVELEDDFQEAEVHCNFCDADFPLNSSPVDNWGTSRGTSESPWELSSAIPTSSVVTEPVEGLERTRAEPAGLPESATGPVAGAQPSPPLPSVRPLVLAMTGASGAPYAVRLLQVLLAAGRRIELVVSPAAAQVLRDEMDIIVDPERFDTPGFLQTVLSRADSAVREHSPLTPGAPGLRSTQHSPLTYHRYTDWSAGIASGSFLTDGMVICPCSMSTLGAIAGGLSTNLIQRAADVHLKERRKLILVPRETPLNLIQLENMTQCVRAGAVVLPAMPGWYHRPRSLDDLVNFVVGRICDQLGVPHELFRRWGDRGLTNDE